MPLLVPLLLSFDELHPEDLVIHNTKNVIVVANNIKSNGLWYYTSNGPATTLGASTSDGAIYSQAYSTSWAGQIAQDYRDGQLFVRGLNNGTW